MVSDDSNEKERWAFGREVGRGMRRPLQWSLLASVLVVALIGTYFFGKAASLAEARGELAGASTEPAGSSAATDSSAEDSGVWEVSESTDPMTDATVRKAFATFAGDQFDVQVSVTCSSAGDISYTATSFDKDHEAAPMRSATTAPRVWGAPAGSQSYTTPRIDPGYVSIAFQMRADDQPPRSLVTTNPQYDNQVLLTAGAVGPLYADGSGIDDAERMAAASKVMLRLFMTTGEATVELPQADSRFRSVVQPCLAQRQAKRQELTAERQQAEAKDQADKRAYIDRLYDDAAVDADTLAWLASNRNVPVDQARLEQKRKREAGLKSRPESDSVVTAM